MQFRSEFTPKPFEVKIKHTDSVLLVGSCFTEQIGNKLAAHKFNILQNPNGILFNPISIAKAVLSYAENKSYAESDLFYYNELWASREHHTQFSNTDKYAALATINQSQLAAHHFLIKANWVFVTLGSAFVYEWKNIAADDTYSNVAANCHKIPTDKFNRRLTNPTEIIVVLQKMQAAILKINGAAKIIYTISPVRHLREGFVENNQSKAALIQAVHGLTNATNVFYFPAYELVIDDLRDYRFFAEDMTHPNYMATNYVWQKFVPACVDADAQLLMSQINELNAAKNHQPFNDTSIAHQGFKQKYLVFAQLLQMQNPYINFESEINYFST